MVSSIPKFEVVPDVLFNFKEGVPTRICELACFMFSYMQTADGRKKACKALMQARPPFLKNFFAATQVKY